MNSPSLDVVVVGAGISGIHLLHRLRGLGFRVLVVEAGDGVGGTWYWNRYPGARCDVESLVYSYSWSDELQQDWHWTERYAPQPEILAYLEHVTDRFDLRRDMRFSTRVTAASWDEPTATWTVATDAGDELTSRFLIMATGCLSVPRLPEVDGLERFAGDVYQTALWPQQGVDFTGLAVGVVGTGSSGVQVCRRSRAPPRTWPCSSGRRRSACRAGTARSTRPSNAMSRSTTPSGVRWPGRRPAGTRGTSGRRACSTATPAERQAEFEARYRVGGFFLHSAYNDLFTHEAANEIISDFVRGKIRERVDDPDLAEQLCPYDYPLATKRMCIDTGYYEAFNRPNVRLVNLRRTPIVRSRTAAFGSAARRPDIDLDALVLATGFDAMTGALAAVDLRGRDDQSLRAKWADGPRTYLGLAHAGFPNLFTITGPSSPSVLSNVMVSIEQHVELVADAAPAPARPRPDLDRAHGGGRGCLGRAPSRTRRGVAVSARQLLVHGRQCARQAARAAALRRRRRTLPADLRAGRRERLRGLRATRAAGTRACGGPSWRVRLARTSSATRFGA